MSECPFINKKKLRNLKVVFQKLIFALKVIYTYCTLLYNLHILHPQPPHLHHGGHSRHREAGGLQGICGHRQHAAHGRYLDSGRQIFHKSKLHTNTYCTTVTNENGN